VFLVIAGTLAVLFFVIFVALGTWQVKRRAWKLNLIARVEQRVHAPAGLAPGPAEWPHVTAATYEYRHVTATGTFLDSSQTLVQALTDLGAGYWVLTPLREADGSVVLVNRGFVTADDRGRVKPGSLPALAASTSGEGEGSPAASTSTGADGSRAASTSTGADGGRVASTSTGADGGRAAATSTAVDGGPGASTITVTGLLRMTEPGGAFLRHNNPGANLWYSRDVQAIAAARGLSHVAPYFIDAEASPNDANAPSAAAPEAALAAAPEASAAAPTVAHAAGATVAPTPGLTVIHFPNSHLVYAITWYTLALMTAIAIPLGMRKQ
jgi:surfeit locus 1 family protein